MASYSEKETLEQKKVKKKLSKAQMQLAIIKKKQCDAKALAIVEHLLEPEVNPQWLLSNLKHINKSHMEDVIEERAIIKLCGYVLCNNPLTRVINQQYHISTKKNKVYDVSLRKNFCSSSCFGACKFLLEQMLTSPLWLRDKEEIPEFELLLAADKLKRSVPGDEIDVSYINTVNPEVKNEDIQDETSNEVQKNVHTVINKYDECAVETVEKGAQAELGRKSDVSGQNLNKFDEEHEDTEDSCTTVIEKDNLKTELNTEDSIPSSQDVENANNSKILEDIENKEQIGSVEEDTVSNENSVERIKQSKQKKHKKNLVKDTKLTEFYNLAIRIELSAREWITEDTICLLSGKEDVKTRLLENIIKQDRYLHLCKRLNKLQMEDEKDDNVNLAMNNLKPLPDLSALQEEGKKMELKVQAFYKGSTVIDNRASGTENKEQDNFTPVLPLTDAHTPKALRRRIFLDKLNRILPDLLRMLSSNRLPQYVYNSEKSTLIKALVNTFSLSAANIVFKTAEWTLVGLIIIKMLSMIDPQLKIVLTTKQASLYISMILMSYKLDPNYLDRLVMELIGNRETSNTDNSEI